MKKYIASKGDFIVHFGFNAEGLLVTMQLPADLTEASQLWLMRNLPICEEDLKHFAKLSKMVVCEIPPDLSFEKFWNEYAYKIGKKERSEKLWNSLKEQEKIQCLQAIPRYKAWLAFKSIEKLYPETFLSQKRFQNDFR